VSPATPLTMQDARTSGRHVVFATIRRSARIARIDIARRTGISAATVTSITAEMLRAGMIEEVEPRGNGEDLKRGRPRVALKVRGAAHLVAGMKISHRMATIAIVDFEGAMIAETSFPLATPRLETGEIARFVRAGLAHAMATVGLSVADLSGVGIGLSGFVDAVRGFVHWSPSLSDRNVQLRDLLAAEIPLPFFLDNDANLVAKAEQLFGIGKGVANFIAITIEQGVGMGVVINHRLYRGARGCGAEFGHTKVQLDGALCRCGQRGCLEAYVADYALLREADSVSLPRQNDTDAGNRLMELYTSAKNGNETAQSIFRRSGRMFAMGLANVINTFDPELIILAGEQMHLDYLYADEVIRAAHSLIVQVDVAPPAIRVHKWGDLMWAKGAAAYAMDGVSELALARLG